MVLNRLFLESFTLYTLPHLIFPVAMKSKNNIFISFLTTISTNGTWVSIGHWTAFQIRESAWTLPLSSSCCTNTSAGYLLY